jgi:hypothetical protein
MNFWTGIIIGVFVGANIGIIVTGVLAASKRSDYAENFDLGQYPMDEAVIDDVIPSSKLPLSLDFRHSDFVHSHAQELRNS